MENLWQVWEMGETSKCHKPTIRGWLTSHFMRNPTTVCPALVMAGGLLSEWSPTRCLESTGGKPGSCHGKTPVGWWLYIETIYYRGWYYPIYCYPIYWGSKLKSNRGIPQKTNQHNGMIKGFWTLLNSIHWYIITFSIYIAIDLGYNPNLQPWTL